MPSFRRKDIIIRNDGAHDSWSGQGMLTAKIVSFDTGMYKKYNWYASRTRCEIRTKMADKLLRLGWTEIVDAAP